MCKFLNFGQLSQQFRKKIGGQERKILSLSSVLFFLPTFHHSPCLFPTLCFALFSALLKHSVTRTCQQQFSRANEVVDCQNCYILLCFQLSVAIFSISICFHIKSNIQTFYINIAISKFSKLIYHEKEFIVIGFSTIIALFSFFALFLCMFTYCNKWIWARDNGDSLTVQ